jgi:Cysteine dioxygenase type I
MSQIRDAGRFAGHEYGAAGAELDAWFGGRAPAAQLTRTELERVVADLAATPALWRPHVRHSATERMYARLHLSAMLEVWLICWSRLQATGYHDHDGSRGAVAIVDGALEEHRLMFGGGSRPPDVHPAGGGFSFGASHIHDVRQSGEELATSLHAYSPPLVRMGFYDVAADGSLSRRIGDPSDEFC